MKKQHIALISLFLFLLIAPTFLYPLLKPVLDTENHENRTLAEFPSVAETGFGFPAAFETYYNDHLPFKNQLTALHSEVFLSLFNTTSNPRVVVGKEGWLFYNNYDAENPIDDLLGKSTFSSQDMETIALNLKQAEEMLQAQDREFCFILPPNKEAIYSEFLPDYLAEKAADASRADMLYDYLLSQNIGIVYPKDALLQEKDSAQLYYKYDTHWNKLGGYIGFREICAELGVELPPLSALLPAEESDGYPKDLAQLAGIGSNCNQDAEYTLSLFPQVTVVHEEESADGSFNRYSSDAADERTVLLIHDSYYKSMIDYFPQVFGEVIAVHRDYTDLYSAQELIEKYDCDIVVMEVVERGATILLHENMPY